jgi:anti-anti-sigma regulatory factor
MATTRVDVGSSCTIRDAAQLKTSLLEALDRPAPIELDAGKVTDIDTAALQLVVAFSLDCLEHNVPFYWSERSAAFNAAVDLAGVGALLESPGTSNHTPVGA